MYVCTLRNWRNSHFFYILSCFNSVLGTKDFMVRTCFFYHSLAIIFDLQIKVVSYIDVNSVLKFRFVFFPQSEDLFQLIESHEGKLLKLYVYNSETDGCREVSTVSSVHGTSTLLGCNNSTFNGDWYLFNGTAHMSTVHFMYPGHFSVKLQPGL